MSHSTSGNGPALSNQLAGLTGANKGQMDVNMMYQKLMELGDLLRDNHEKTRGIVASAEQFAMYRVDNGPKSKDSSAHDDPVLDIRIADLTHENLELRATKDLLLREQREHGKLLGEYENAVGEILERLRNISFEKEAERTKTKREYNRLLQEEKDAHLQTRLDKDEWHSRFLQALDMLRKAHKLRSLEEEEPFLIISGLQNEVRGYRHALGLDPEAREDELGYEFLRLK